MKCAVIVLPGSNCDRDIAVALRKVSGKKVSMIWHKETKIPKLDLIVIPGGFSYGDYLRSGAMAAHSPVIREVVSHSKKGALVLGICNGFQILTESGLLPGALLRNASLKFICRNVHLRVESVNNPFTKGYTKKQTVKIPIAHGDGNYFINKKGIKEIEDNEQIAFRYCNAEGGINTESNPNGSLMNIAGILNRNKNVLGMMPHPERVSDKFTGGSDGEILFQGIIEGLSK